MFMGPQNWFQGMNSASLCSPAGRYENPIPPRCLASIDFLKIPAQSHTGTKVVWPDFQPMRVPEEPVCIDLFRQNPVFTSRIWNLPFMSTASGNRDFFSSCINPTYVEQILYSTVVRVSKLLSLSKYIRDRALIEKKVNSKPFLCFSLVNNEISKALME